jgi:very-short-patch-repair endonuclease
MTTRDADVAMRRLAARQYGLASKVQARRCGLDRAGIGRRVRSGVWETVSPRVLRLVGVESGDRGRLMAALLDAGPDAVACGRSAAALLGLPGFDLSGLEVAVPRGRTRSSGDLAIVHERVTMRADHRMLLHGIPTTIVPLTLLDVAATASPGHAERALDFALSRRLVSVRRLKAVLAEPGGRGRAGTALLRALVDVRADVPHQPTGLERRVLRILSDAGVPLPRQQVDLGDDAWVGRVDFMWPGRPAVVLEVDSEAFHTSVLDREADAARDERLTAAGYVLGRVTELQVWHRPWEVVATARRLLRQTTAEVA